MENEFIYFFKHKEGTAVKIGRTSGESVLSRFNSFRTYCPHNGEILGFFKTENARQVEAHLHKKFDAFRLCGEWFDITTEMVQAVINNYDDSYLVAQRLFNEWISDKNNNLALLMQLMRVANKVTADGNIVDQFSEIISISLAEGDNQATTAEILAHIQTKIPNFNLNARQLARRLGKMGFTQSVFRNAFGIATKGYKNIELI